MGPGVIGFVLGTTGAIATIPMHLGPAWYPIAIAATALPCAWLGGMLVVAKRSQTRERIEAVRHHCRNFVGLGRNELRQAQAPPSPLHRRSPGSEGSRRRLTVICVLSRRVFRRIFAESLFKDCRVPELARVDLSEGSLEGLMSAQRIEEPKEGRLIRRHEKTYPGAPIHRKTYRPGRSAHR